MARCFAYFARKESAQTFADIAADSWIAVSRPPWFTALALWTIGGTYCAGAHFVDRRTLFVAGITQAPDRGSMPRWFALSKNAAYIDRTNDWTDRTVYFNRLMRDGWTPIGEISSANPWWEHRSLDDRQTLIMMPRHDGSFNDYGGRHTTEYGLRDESDGSLRELGRGTWADWDQRGRLVIARDGRLVEILGASETEIADLNPQAPDPKPSPTYASEWPRDLR
jgi:hypothetical protein